MDTVATGMSQMLRSSTCPFGSLDPLVAVPADCLAMPAFASAPEVFPPIVPATRAGGDLPMFAFCRRGSVVAWSQPDGFAARQEVRSVGLDWADGEHLSLNLYYVWEPDEAARSAKADAVAQGQHDRLRTMPEKLARSNMPLQDYVVELDEWVQLLTLDGPARVLRYRYALTDKKLGRVSNHLEFVYLVREVSPRLTVVAELKNLRQETNDSTPATELLLRWRRCLPARGPAIQGPDLACWLDVFGFVTEDAQKVAVDCVSGWEVSEAFADFRHGEDVRAWLLPPVDRSRFDLDFEIRETMRRIGNIVNESAGISVTSRDVPVPGLELPVFASYEVEALAEPMEEAPWHEDYARRLDALGRPAGWDPGRRIRTVFILLDEDTVVGLRMDIGGRLYDRLEAFWADVCARCWLWREAR